MEGRITTPPSMSDVQKRGDDSAMPFALITLALPRQDLL
jgi:hypothetical protein